MKERNHSLDYLRAISCFLVIIIHIANVYCRAYTKITEINYVGAVIFNSIARISVPIFFMISGALLIKNNEFNMKKYLKRIWRLVLALIVWNLIYFIFNHCYLGESGSFLDAAIESFFEPAKRHLWFMYAIIGIYIALPFIQNMCKNLSKTEENLFIGLWMFFVGIVYIINLKLKTEVSYPIPIIQATYYLGYFIVGHFLSKRVNELNLKKWNKYLWLIPIVCFAIIILSTCNLSFKYDKYYKSMLGYRSIFYMLSSISIFLLFIINKEKFKENKLVLSISNLSFGIYLMHPIFQNIITNHINIIEQSSYIFIPIYSLIIFILTYLSCFIIKKIPILNKILG